jgi:CBS domain-containing protein
MKIQDIMTRGVHFVSPDATLMDAARQMDDHDVGVLPVREGDRLSGIITDRDIVIRSVSAGLDPKEALVRDSMTAPVITCTEETSVEDAAKICSEKKVRRLVVLDREQRLVGIVTVDAIARATSRHGGNLVEAAA